MNVIIITYLLGFFFNNSESSSKKECEGLKNEKRLYYPLRHCQKSNKNIIAFNNFENVEECADFARNSNGLAFNYSPKSRSFKKFYDISNNETNEEIQLKRVFHNCEVIDCPEKNNFSTVINDTRYDYYTLYSYPVRKSSNIFRKDT